MYSLISKSKSIDRSVKEIQKQENLWKLKRHIDTTDIDVLSYTDNIEASQKRPLLNAFNMVER